MKGTIIWVKSKALCFTKETPDQRCRIEGIGNGHLLVTLLGDITQVKAISAMDICGMELDDETEIKFTVHLTNNKRES